MDSETIEQAAARWVIRQEGGSWTETDQQELDAWLNASIAHRVQYLRVIAAWRHTGRLKALGAGVPAGVIPARDSWGDARFPGGRPAETHPPPGDDSDPAVALATQPNVSRSRRGLRGGLLALAASIVLASAGIAIYFSGIFAGEGYSTPVGGVRSVALTDGSHITLNTDSRIHVVLGERERVVALDRGEAFFEVAKDPERPFVVETHGKRVVAVGTKFSVRQKGDDIEVVVTEGKVRIETASDSGSGSAAGNAFTGSRGLLLAAGGVARTAKEQVMVRSDSLPEAEKLLSWREGYVAFDDLALADAVAEFNRYNTRKIVIAEPQIAALRLSGNFRANNSDAFLWLLESGFPVKVERHDDEVILRSR